MHHSDFEIRHNTSQQRFECTVDGQPCVARYRLNGKVMVMSHTGVPPPLEGRGIAAALVRAALEHALATGLKIDPACSYVRVYMQRHPETQSLLA